MEEKLRDLWMRLMAEHADLGEHDIIRTMKRIETEVFDSHEVSGTAYDDLVEPEND